MNQSRAKQIVDAFAGKRVLVVGDVMLDEYIWGRVSRISPEAPVMVVEAQRYSHVPGGAANVVNNLCALGAPGMIVGVIGGDETGKQLVAALTAEGADTDGLVIAEDRSTTRKTRIIAHSQQVVRVDRERRAAIDSDSARHMIERIRAHAAFDAILISDYQKGVVSPELLAACIDVAHRSGRLVIGNLKPAALTAAAALDVITVNLNEVALATGQAAIVNEDAAVESAGRLLLAITGCKQILISRGAHGLTSIASSGEVHHVSAIEIEVYDPAGAGDTVVSTLALALTAGAEMLEAMILANHAAAEVVKKVGVATVSPAEIIASFDQ